MSFDGLLALGIVVAGIGMLLQLVYLPQGIADLRDRRRKIRAALLEATSAAERAAVRRDGRAVLFFIASRLAGSLALMTVHILIVSTVAIVLRVTRATHPSEAAFQLAWIRVAVSGVVIVSTASQIAARRWAVRR